MSQLSYTGNSLIIIRDFSTKKVLAEIDKANYVLHFMNHDTGAQSKHVNLAAYEEFSPDSISVSGIILTKSIANLLYNKNKIEDVNVLFPVSEFQIISDDGTAFLSQLPANKNIYFREVESGEYSLVNPDLINLDTGEIIGMKEDSNIDFLYYVNSSSSLQYTFDKKRLEYVTIEIINQGNSSNRGSKMYLKIDRASLSIRDSFNFDKMSIAQASLNFKIIDNTLKVFYY